MNHPARKGIRWVFAEGLAHVLAEDPGNASERVTVCGLAVPVTAPVYRVAPSLDLCQACERRTLLDVAPPEFPTMPTVY